jgi:hypothetical protein
MHTGKIGVAGVKIAGNLANVGQGEKPSPERRIPLYGD